MSRDGTYILKYHPGVAMNGQSKEHDMEIISKQSPSVEFKELSYDIIYFEMPKYTLLYENIKQLHADQVLESCDGDNFEEKQYDHS